MTQLLTQKHGSTNININAKNIKQLQIPLPPLSTQKKIVAILEKAEELRRQREQADKWTGEFLQSVFLEIFGDPVRNEKGWEVRNSNDICYSISVGIVIKPASYYVPHGIPALRSLNVKKNRVDLSNLVYISEKDNNEKVKKSKLKENDILIVRSGYPGTSCVVPKTLDGANCIDLIIARPIQDTIKSEFQCQ